MELEKTIDTEYVDSLILTKEDMKTYNIPATFINVTEKLRDYKIARNKYINGLHVRLTPSYKPRIESFTKRKIDPIGDGVVDYFDSEEHYNYFNYMLNKLYSIMSEVEIAYLNDCLLCGRSESYVRDIFKISKTPFSIIKDSAIVRFGLVFNVIVYK